MGVKEAFVSLKEIFPQIDARILRAVALEHKDVGDAVDAVLSHVIPFLSSVNGNLSDSAEGISAGGSSQDVAASVSTVASTSNSFFPEKPSQDVITLSPDVPEYSALPLDLSAGKLSEGVDHDSGNSNAPLNGVQNDHNVKEALREKGKSTDADYLNALGFKIFENTEIDEAAPQKFPEGSKEMAPESIPDQKLQNHQDGNGEGENSGISSEQMTLDANLRMKIEETALAAPVVELESSSSTFGTGRESSMSSSLSQSTQKHTIEVIEDLIDDAKNNRKEVSVGMLLVRMMMEKVELEEKAAEEARSKATVVLTDALARAEELKHMVQRAEEEKCMYAGEVYSEKAIQATEMKELHLRVLSLSDERHKTLSLLNEISHNLQVRLAAAENEIISAAREREEKEKVAMETCAEQELALQKVAEEMKMLEQLSKENAKVHEFLLDRGHVVDALQGEIAVVYQDAKQLKEKLDENVPLSKLLSSSQVCYNVAASSPSSPQVTDEQAMEKEDDDGWEIFEKPVARAAPEMAC